jgi:hypothetical protein
MVRHPSGKPDYRWAASVARDDVAPQAAKGAPAHAPVAVQKEGP